MKKVLRYLLMTVMAICFSIPCFGAAEAASVAPVSYTHLHSSQARRAGTSDKDDRPR